MHLRLHVFGGKLQEKRSDDLAGPLLWSQREGTMPKRGISQQWQPPEPKVTQPTARIWRALRPLIGSDK
jgi:hypothetical protein